MLIVTLTGPHGTGKTTFAHTLASVVQEDHSTIIVESQFSQTLEKHGLTWEDLSDPENAEIVIDIHVEQAEDMARRRDEAAKTHELVICDRSPVDSYIYSALHYWYSPDYLENPALYAELANTFSLSQFAKLSNPGHPHLVLPFTKYRAKDDRGNRKGPPEAVNTFRKIMQAISTGPIPELTDTQRLRLVLNRLTSEPMPYTYDYIADA